MKRWPTRRSGRKGGSDSLTHARGMGSSLEVRESGLVGEG